MKKTDEKCSHCKKAIRMNEPYCAVYVSREVATSKSAVNIQSAEVTHTYCSLCSNFFDFNAVQIPVKKEINLELQMP